MTEPDMLGKPLMEHRWGTRIPLAVPAEIKTRDGQRNSATVRNASVSGALIETTLKLALLSRVCVRPLSRPEPGLDAHVVRAAAGGFAVEWSYPGAHPVSDMLPLRDAGTPQPQTHVHPQRPMSRDPEDILALEF
jgi:hypothetical protein